jgi:hypothetical protein
MDKGPNINLDLSIIFVQSGFDKKEKTNTRSKHHALKSKPQQTNMEQIEAQKECNF